MGRAQVPDKNTKPFEGGGGGGKPLMVPINIVCAPEPIQNLNEVKTVCSHFYLHSILSFKKHTNVNCELSKEHNLFSSLNKIFSCTF